VKCREFTEFIADYLAGALEEETRALFERHLSRCENCRRYLSNYQATLSLEQDAFEDDDADVPAAVPEDLIQAILKSRPR
jgi:predicted anti-sigma-YlaC factor YlaD